ncbi:30S ribosomal protein S12 methylthiotransferase RimO [Treponema parvum]|uniref:Ribosomal protein uS12 methylthiotransferase RimO n=1 Tax=Treponema parvum TaxID=138851 RepID=A0A975F7H6_9SPIR|nr:30S ribosomal protein S12 methylthiotransferase RimO [Treponema parvum]
MTDPEKRFFLDQHGCAKNKVDGELLIDRLCAMGFAQSFDPSKADLIIVNSCGFIESAKKESLEALYSARSRFPEAKILLAGCLAERYAKIFDSELPEADGIFGNGDLSKIDDTVIKMFSGARPVMTPAQKGVCCGDRSMLLTFRGSAYVKITEGCDNRCSFCAIPLIRGNLRSRPAVDIISEIKRLISKGVYEINLIGQDSAAWGTGEEDDVFGNGPENLFIGAAFEKPASDKTAFFEQGSSLSRLLRMISALEGNFRLRLLYIHPDHFNRNILPVIRSDKRILPYFDIPFQSGDDEIIRSMNRTGNAKSYKRLIEDIRRVLPDAVVRTTFLTGFPGETDEKFENTCKFLKDIRPDWSGCFSYSREEDTPSYGYKGRVSKKIAEKRAKDLSDIQKKITAESLLRRVNKDYDVMVEEVLDAADGENLGFAIGRAWFQAPEVDGSVVIRYDRNDSSALKALKPGRLVRVRAVAAGDVDLDAVFTADSPENKGIREQSKTLLFAPEIDDESK